MPVNSSKMDQMVACKNGLYSLSVKKGSFSEMKPFIFSMCKDYSGTFSFNASILLTLLIIMLS